MLQDFISSVTGEVTSELGSVLPAAAGIVGVLAAFSVGWKLYKKVTGART